MKLLEFFKDGDGLYSSTRLMMLMWNACVASVWVYMSIKTGVIAQIDLGVLGALGIAQAAKVTQSFSENK